ncbi:DUF2207 domain-containing protein [Leuconostoc rapi]|uniref:DUF2207 domain-containing protein n=1 Tax=Leuconostoc rapi TaxID=1406906 RepID=UPI0019570EFB|nr:DUF2207 domain-containing protein [Leuconostoc rapi]MBM7435375.1 putative membrane protein [Leuconostoc rapi]
MKTIAKLTMAVLFSLLVGIKVVQADYHITNYQQQVQIGQDGTAKIDKTVTYKFDDDMNGVYLKEKLMRSNSGGQPYQWGGMQSVVISKNGGQFQSVAVHKNGSDIGYVESKTDTHVQEKVYYPIKAHDKIIVKYTYQLKNIVINWDDVAEINWLIIDDWDRPLKQIKIVVSLPQKPAKTLKGWVHSGAKGQIDVDKENARLVITAFDVKANEKLELRAYFDKAQTPANTNIQAGQRAKTISQTEAQKAIKHNQKLRLIAIFGFIIIPVIVLGMVILTLWDVFHIRAKLRRAKQRSGVDQTAVHIYELPNDLGPAIINDRIQQRAEMPQVIVATLMDLIARRKITITYQDVRDVDQALYQVINEDNLADFEMSFMTMIFGKKREPVHQDDFQKPESRVSRRIRQKIGQFQRDVADESIKKTIIDARTTRKMTHDKIAILSVLSFISVSAMIALIVMANYSDIWQLWLVSGAILVLSSASLVMLGIQSTTFFTEPDGFVEKWQWAGFASMLHDIAKLNDKTVLDVQLWDKLLAYAVIFGEAKTVAKTLKVWANDMNISTTSLPVYMIYSSFGMNWSSNLTSHIQTDVSFDSNVSGSGGSFSGGYSGGGGGGGGGAF